MKKPALRKFIVGKSRGNSSGRARALLAGRSGQSLTLVALTIMVLAMFSFMVVSVGRLTYTRIRMQTAADAAALTAARQMARSLNLISQADLTMNGVLSRFRSFYAVESRLLSAFRAARTIIDTAVRAGSGGWVSIAARDAARRNGAEGIIPGIARMHSLQLRRVQGNPWVYRIVYGIPIPWPPFRAGRGTVYYERTWSPSLRRAQPPHRLRYVAYAAAPAPFAATLFRGIRTSARTRVNAVAEAKIWLDMRPETSTLLHSGGFPRRTERWLDGIGIQAFMPQFNSSLTNVTLMGGRDNPILFH